MAVNTPWTSVGRRRCCGVAMATRKTQAIAISLLLLSKRWIARNIQSGPKDSFRRACGSSCSPACPSTCLRLPSAPAPTAVRSKRRRLPVSPALGAGCVAAAALAAFGFAVDCSRQLASPRTSAEHIWAKNFCPPFPKTRRRPLALHFFHDTRCAKPSLLPTCTARARDAHSTGRSATHVAHPGCAAPDLHESYAWPHEFLGVHRQPH